MDAPELPFLQAMARRYCWDMPDPDEGARTAPDRVVRRVMDLGVLEDALALEPTLGRARLVDILRASPPGAMRSRSWWFWHYRLGLADADHDPPPMPIRTFARAEGHAGWLLRPASTDT